MSIHYALLVLALGLFALGAFGVPSGRGNYVAAGLFCWLLGTTAF